MGVDISIFAREAKKYVHLDRDWVFCSWQNENERYAQLSEHFRDPEMGLTTTEAVEFFGLLKTDHNADEDREEDRVKYAEYWLDEAAKFVKRYPNDLFFALHDHDDRYYEEKYDKGFKKDSE